MTVRAIIGSFKALRGYADFDTTKRAEGVPEQEGVEEKSKPSRENGPKIPNLKLGYTINLNLPATSDVAVLGRKIIFQKPLGQEKFRLRRRKGALLARQES